MGSKTTLDLFDIHCKIRVFLFSGFTGKKIIVIQSHTILTSLGWVNDGKIFILFLQNMKIYNNNNINYYMFGKKNNHKPFEYLLLEILYFLSCKMICFQGDNHLDEKYGMCDVNKHKVNITFASCVIYSVSQLGKRCKIKLFFFYYYYYYFYFFIYNIYIQIYNIYIQIYELYFPLLFFPPHNVIKHSTSFKMCWNWHCKNIHDFQKEMTVFSCNACL